MSGRPAAAVGAAVHFVAAPGVMIGLLPWLLTRWVPADDPWPIAVRIAGLGMLVVGVCVVSAEFVRFVREGRGTPAPVAPTEALVVGGLYAHVRNPMYLAVTSAIVGQGLWLGRPVLLGYAAVFAGVVFTFVRVYEEPTLAETFGHQYDAYRAAVPGWLPRLHAWRP